MIDIAVVYERIPGMLQSVCVVFPAGLAFIEIGSYPRVHDQLANRECIEDIYEVIELVRVIVAEARLNRDLHIIGNNSWSPLRRRARQSFYK